MDLAALEEIRSAHFGEMVKFCMSLFIFRLNDGIHMTEPLLFQWVLSFVHTNGFCKLPTLLPPPCKTSSDLARPPPTSPPLCQ